MSDEGKCDHKHLDKNNINDCNQAYNDKKDKSKLYLKKKITKKNSNKEENKGSTISSKKSETSKSSFISNGIETRRSEYISKKMNKANEPLLNKINNYKKMINKHISLNRDRINVLKKIQDKYNIPYNLTKKEKKGKSFHSKNKYTNKIKSNDIPKKFEVKSVLKNLQEMIKNQIILCPEDLKFDEDLMPIKKKSKPNKEKGISKFSKKNIKSFQPGQIKFLKRFWNKR